MNTDTVLQASPRKIKKDASLLAQFTGRKVYIWSYEHGQYWRSNNAGYTPELSDAGVYDFEAALKSTLGCGPEKGIELRTVPTSRGLQGCPHCGSDLVCRPYKPGYIWSIACPKCPYLFQGVFQSVEDMVEQCNRRFK